MNTSKQFVPVSRNQRMVAAVAATIASTLVFIAVLSLATPGGPAAEHAQAQTTAAVA